MDTSVRVAHGMTRGRKGRGLRGAIGDTDSRSTSGPDPAAGDIRIVTFSSYTFDHTIDLKDNAMPRHGPIYSLSEPEHAALKEFIDDHLATGTVHPSQSPIGALVLFVKKKMAHSTWWWITED